MNDPTAAAADDDDDTSDNRLHSQNIQRVVEDLLYDELFDEQYEPHRCKLLSEKLASQALQRINLSAATHQDNCKYVVMMSLGSVSCLPSAAAVGHDGTVFFGSRCLWNRLTDYFTTAQFHNSSLFAVASIFTVHFDPTCRTDSSS